MRILNESILNVRLLNVRILNVRISSVHCIDSFFSVVHDFPLIYILFRYMNIHKSFCCGSTMLSYSLDCIHVGYIVESEDILFFHSH